MSAKIIAIILAVLLVIAVGYIVLEKYRAIQQQNQLLIYQQGGAVGYQTAIVDIAKMAATCQQVPLILGNQTINMVAVECLKK